MRNLDGAYRLSGWLSRRVMAGVGADLAFEQIRPEELVVDGRRPVPRGLLRVEKTADGPNRTLSLFGEVDLSNVHRVERELRSLSAGQDCDG